MTGPRQLLACFFLLLSLIAFTGPTASALTARDDRPTLFFDYAMVANHSELLILADVPIKEHKAFLLANPARLVLDIHGFSLLEEVVGLPVNRPELTCIRIAKHPDKIRFVFDLTENKNITHEVLKLDTGLKVIIKIDSRAVISASKTKKGKKGATRPAPPGGTILAPDSFPKIFSEQRVTILFHKAPIREFFAFVADKCGLTIEVSKNITATISLRLTDVPLSNAVKEIKERYGLQLLIDGNHLEVVKAEDARQIPSDNP
ncbi:MAG: AMIN domain-containing protein [Desulfobulbaceae bacterium]|nr:AMIN domain-containing protein [Desulfobulbaceae bacterium]